MATAEEPVTVSARHVHVKGNFVSLNGATIHARHIQAVGPGQVEIYREPGFWEARYRSSGIGRHEWDALRGRNAKLLLVIACDGMPKNIAIEACGSWDHEELQRLQELIEQAMRDASPTLGELLATKTPEVRNKIRVLLDLLEAEGVRA